MDAYKFNGEVLVEAQGPRILRLVANQLDHAEYEVVGFQNSIVILDYRPDALDTLDCFMKDSRSIDFGQAFSQPAAAEITVAEDFIFIRLYDSVDKEPSHMLWIAVGLENELPVLDYEILKIEPIQGGTLAVFALSRLSEPDSQLELPLHSLALL